MNPLDELKDIHLPSTVDWWPLAPGWWVSAVLVLIIVALLWALLRKRKQNKQRLNLVMVPFETLASDTSLSSQDWLNELSMLIRRIAISSQGRNDTAGLVGSDWLAYLDKSGNTNGFSEGAGKVLAEQPYRPAVEYDREAITTLARAWAKEQYKRGYHA